MICTVAMFAWTWAFLLLYRPFPTEDSIGDDDIYSGLSDQIE